MHWENIRFIDLFAGIGGFHQALNHFGAKCVFASEIDKYANQTYFENYGIKPFGDITKIDESEIPQHDILCAGFPCQAFSISGKQNGFNDTRGTLFFDIARIVSYHSPKILFLENVKNFVRHNEGKTLKTVLNTLDDLGYNVFYEVLNASDFGLPQNRERVYLVGFRKDLNIEQFSFPTGQHSPVALLDFLEDEPKDVKNVIRDDIILNREFIPQFNLRGEIALPNRPIQIGIVGKGGQGERIYHPLGHAITLSAYGGGVGSRTGLYKINDKIRKLSPRECARIQGFPESFKIISNKTQAYQQFGNSVAINVLIAILKEIDKKAHFIKDNLRVKFNDKQLIGSETAKDGFKNEVIIASKFNDYKKDCDAMNWLNIMGYDYNKIKTLKALQIPVRLNTKNVGNLATSKNIDFETTQKLKKTDIQIQLTITMNDDIIYRENISVKKADANFNQIDKRSVDTYQAMWGFNNKIASTLKKFTGAIKPTPQESEVLRDKRR